MGNPSPTRVAARPIPLDRSEVNALIDRMKRKIGQISSFRKDMDSPLGDHKHPIVQEAIEVEDVLGQHKAITVVMISKMSRSGEFWLGAGFGHLRRGGRPVIILEANGKYPKKMFAEMDGLLRRDLLKTLMHELSHAADVGKGSAKPGQKGIPTEGEMDLHKYYNNRGEVRAHMRELYEELRPTIHKVMGHKTLADDWGKSGAFNRMLRTTETWKRIEPYLTPQNRKKVLKGVITAFEDEGWTSPKRVAARYLLG